MQGKAFWVIPGPLHVPSWERKKKKKRRRVSVHAAHALSVGVCVRVCVSVS